MKLLMIYMDEFAYRTRVKNLDSVEDISEEKQTGSVLVGFIHVEAEDMDQEGSVETKLVKNLKWAARKNNTDNIILHSFAHLSESKADPDFTKAMISRAEKRLIDAGYTAMQTPFGYFLDLDIKAPGKSLARIFKSF